ncbi:MAG: OsmC family protein [Sedimentisphaerales bacterium]|nr:OsmC family protein [Sedimentisphaerales bacterium]
MEVLVKHENGFRFSATCRGHTVTTGRGNDGNERRDGMWPAQLFEASIGMCIGGYVAKFCEEQAIAYDGMTIELSRHTQAGPSRTARIDAKIYLDSKLSEEQKQGILHAADQCHITNSIREAMQIACSLADTKSANA